MRTADRRFTRDTDAAVMVADDADGERLVWLLIADRYRPLASVEQDETGRLATVRLACPLGDGDVVVDLLSRRCYCRGFRPGTSAAGFPDTGRCRAGRT